MNQFAELGVNARTVAALERAGITIPVQVQAETIQAAIAGQDVVIEAPTGSGKSLAFLLPMIERLKNNPNPMPRALIVCPTRELAMQIDAVIGTLSPGLRRLAVFGGVGYGQQTGGLRRGTDVVIGTPGRLLDLANRGLLRLGRVEYLVLDEADEMLDSGFAPDVERIMGKISAKPQTILASATMPEWINKMISAHLTDPHRVKVAPAEEVKLEHGLMRLQSKDRKLEALSTLLHASEGATITFGRTKHGVAKLTKDLARLGHSPQELHGNMNQNQRQRALAAFRNDPAGVLVATNVAARGLDISSVDLIINYDLPETPQWLTHRVGRTARNGAEGRALTFLSPEDHDAWRKLRRLGAPDLPEVDTRALLLENQWHLRPATPLPAGQPAQSQRPHGFGNRRFQGRGAASGPRRGSYGGRPTTGPATSS